MRTTRAAAVLTAAVLALGLSACGEPELDPRCETYAAEKGIDFERFMDEFEAQEQMNGSEYDPAGAPLGVWAYTNWTPEDLEKYRAQCDGKDPIDVVGTPPEYDAWYDQQKQEFEASQQDKPEGW